MLCAACPNAALGTGCGVIKVIIIIDDSSGKADDALIIVVLKIVLKIAHSGGHVWLWGGLEWTGEPPREEPSLLLAFYLANSVRVFSFHLRTHLLGSRKPTPTRVLIVPCAHAPPAAAHHHPAHP